MENKTIRKETLNWFESRFHIKSNEVYASKFYSPSESWNNSRVWFFQIPLHVVYSPVSKDIHLLCENHLVGEPFLYLKVKSLFLAKNLKAFDVYEKERTVRIYISAEAVNMFTEVRGKGKVNFKSFVVE